LNKIFLSKIFAPVLFLLIFAAAFAFAQTDADVAASSETAKAKIDALSQNLQNVGSQNKKIRLTRELAENLEQSGDSDDAIILYKDILGYDDLSKKDTFKYNVKIGDLYYYRKEYTPALNYYFAARSIYDDNMELNLKIGDSLLNNNLYTLAEKSFLDVLSQNKKSDYAKRRLGDIYLKQNMYLKAVQYYESVDRSYLNRQTVINMAVCYRNMDNYDKAIKLLTGDSTYDDDAEISFLLGMLYYDGKKYEEAEAAFLKSIDADSGNVSAYIYLASVYEELSELKKAEDCLDKASKINSDMAVTDLMRARISYKMKNTAAAKRYAQNAYKNAKSPFVREQAGRMIDFFNGK